MSLEVQQQPRGRQPPDDAQLPQRTDGAARKVRHDARALLRRDRADTSSARPTPACGSASARRPPAPRPNTGRSPRRDRRADARVRVRVVKCRERRKERTETRLRPASGQTWRRACKPSSCSCRRCVGSMMSGMPASSVSVCSAPATRASRSFSSSGATAPRFAASRSTIGSTSVRASRMRASTTSCSVACAHRCAERRAGERRQRAHQAPTGRRRRARAGVVDRIDHRARAHADAAMGARAQRRACGSLPSFGETRRGIRRHGDARLGAAKRVERDAKLRQQHRRLRHAHRIVVGERVCRRAAEHDVMHSLRRCRHAHRQRRPHAPHTRVDGIALQYALR
jgi:hypothetical protein